MRPKRPDLISPVDRVKPIPRLHRNDLVAQKQPGKWHPIRKQFQRIDAPLYPGLSQTISLLKSVKLRPLDQGLLLWGHRHNSQKISSRTVIFRLASLTGTNEVEERPDMCVSCSMPFSQQSEPVCRADGFGAPPASHARTFADRAQLVCLMAVKILWSMSNSRGKYNQHRMPEHIVVSGGPEEVSQCRHTTTRDHNHQLSGTDEENELLSNGKWTAIVASASTPSALKRGLATFNFLLLKDTSL